MLGSGTLLSLEFGTVVHELTRAAGVRSIDRYTRISCNTAIYSTSHNATSLVALHNPSLTTKKCSCVRQEKHIDEAAQPRFVPFRENTQIVFSLE